MHVLRTELYVTLQLCNCQKLVKIAINMYLIEFIVTGIISMKWWKKSDGQEIWTAWGWYEFSKTHYSENHIDHLWKLGVNGRIILKSFSLKEIGLEYVDRIQMTR